MVQIFVKVNGSKTSPMEVSLTDDRVEDVMRRIQNDENAYVTLHGRVLKRGEKLKSCGVTDGCTIQVTSRIRGGGKHKDKKSKVEKKQVTRQEPVRNEGPAILGSEKEADGFCAMVCEQMKWAMETMNTLQSTDEDKRRIAEEVEKVKKAMANMEKQATGGDLQRVAEMEESFKKLEKEVQAKDVETGEKKVTREGRGCTGLVQGGDETHEMNESSRRGKGKGNGGKGEHGGKEGVRVEEEEYRWDAKRKVVRTMKREEDQEADEEERCRVAPNMGAGGSHPQAMSDPGNRDEEKREARVLSWADCKDEEEMTGGETTGSGRRRSGKRAQDATRGEAHPGGERAGGARGREERARGARTEESRKRRKRRRGKRRRRERKRRRERRRREKNKGERRKRKRKRRLRRSEKEWRERPRLRMSEKEMAREAKAQEERREQDREDVAQEGHEGEVKAQEEQGERREFNARREPRVEQTHDVVAQRMVGPSQQRTTPADGKRPSKSVASSHQGRAGSARHGKGRRGKKGETGARKDRKQHLAHRFPLQPNNRSSSNCSNNASAMTQDVSAGIMR